MIGQTLIVGTDRPLGCGSVRSPSFPGSLSVSARTGARERQLPDIKRDDIALVALGATDGHGLESMPQKRGEGLPFLLCSEARADSSIVDWLALHSFVHRGW